MRLPIRLLLVLTLLALATGCAAPATATASPTPPPLPSATAAPTVTTTPSADEQMAAKLDEAFSALAGEGKFSGAVLVARDGQVLFSRGYGLANVDLQIPNTPAVKFHIGSASKQFTAMAILQLQSQGKLNVQDQVCKYIKDCPAAWAPITIQQLLIHTSGIPDLNKAPGLQDFILHPHTPLELIALFRDLPLDFTPGEKYSYSNSGYYLLGVVIENVSGLSYADFLQKNIFDPLQMKDSGYDIDPNPGQDFAIGYTDASTRPPFVDKSIQYAAAGLYSTVGDLLLWDQALYTDKLVPASLVAEMFTPFVPIPASSLSGGYGWYIGKQFDHPWMYYAGGANGFLSALHRFPDSHMFIVMLANRSDIDFKAIHSLISPIIFGQPWVSPFTG
jgi:CubicO group peptidase (beta-lactamase class C family)